VNQQHIQRLSAHELAARLEPVLRAEGLWRDDLSSTRQEWFLAVIRLFQPRIRKLDQFAHEARPLFVDDVTYEQEAVVKHLKPEIREPLSALADTLASLDGFAAASLETTLRALAESRKIKAAALIHATRVAVTGRAASPGLFEMLELAGRERVVARLRHAATFVSAA
jgi:glutamyl-tRNA synthetase